MRSRPASALFPRTDASRGWSWRWRSTATSPLPSYGRLSGNASTLSGGNQQKLVLAKWLGRHPSLLIVDEPTRGIDVATKAEVHRLLEALAAEEAVAVLMISSELPEVLRMGDRTLVMREGRLVAEFSHSEVSEEHIVAAATGQTAAAGDLVTTDAMGHDTP